MFFMERSIVKFFNEPSMPAKLDSEPVCETCMQKPEGKDREKYIMWCTSPQLTTVGKKQVKKYKSVKSADDFNYPR